jgi:hypothetical protein
MSTSADAFWETIDRVSAIEAIEAIEGRCSVSENSVKVLVYSGKSIANFLKREMLCHEERDWTHRERCIM